MKKLVRSDNRLAGKSDVWNAMYNAHLVALLNTNFHDLVGIEECRKMAREYATKHESSPVELNNLK